MRKKLMALFLVIVTLMSVANIGGIALAEETSTNITVYLSISKYGEIVKDKNGNDMSCREISLSGNTSYNINDILSAAHALYHRDGANSYSSSVTTSWGLSIDKLWGDTSYNFGYQVNGGSEPVMNLSHEVEYGDFIDAYIIKSSYPDSEAYTTFDNKLAEVFVDDSISLTLTEMGFDEEFNTIFAPCEGATITINGEETDVTTNSDGEANITIDTVGTYTISAQKTKTIEEQLVTAITAPVCRVTVAEKPSVQIIHNIAQSYINSDLLQEGGNLPWILADLAVYQELYPESSIALSPEQKQIYLDKLIEDAEEATSPGDLAKTIIALRSLGYDAKHVYTKDLDELDVVSKLLNLVDDEDSAVTNAYTLPYVIIALSQSEEYATGSQMDYLLSAAIETKDDWQDTSWGTDSITPMLMALAPYCSSNTDVEEAVSDAVDIVKSLQLESGLLLVPEDFESASAALTIAGFSALGIDSETVTNGGENLIDGLMSMATPELDGFDNAFAKEQGLRGLLAHRMLKSGLDRCVYDFSLYPLNEAHATWAENCPVTFIVTPENARISVRGVEPVKGNKYDLAEGRYSYTVSKDGFKDKNGTITISEDDVLYHTPVEITVSLSRGGNGVGGGGASSGVTNKADNIREEEPENPEQTEIRILTPDTFSDVTEDDWYYDSVKYVYENNLFVGSGDGFEPDGNMTRAMLVTVLHRADSNADADTSAQSLFTDIESGSWYEEAVLWANKNEIVNGVTDTSFAPDETITREQIAVIIYRFALYKGLDTSAYLDTDISSYADFGNISDYAIEAMKYACGTGIISGRSASQLAPDGYATRAEVATILMRFIGQ